MKNLFYFNFHDPTKWNLGSIGQYKDLIDSIDVFEITRCLYECTACFAGIVDEVGDGDEWMFIDVVLQPRHLLVQSALLHFTQLTLGIGESSGFLNGCIVACQRSKRRKLSRSCHHRHLRMRL